MAGRILLVAAVVAAISFAAAPARSAGALPAERGLASAPAYLVSRRPTLAPYAFVRFCRDNPADCRRATGADVVALTPSRARALSRINGRINREIRPVREAGGGDRWAADVAAGDCEDVALTKRRALVTAGWPARALRLATTRTASGEGHAVLVLRTTRGDLVLDNRSAAIRPWRQTDLDWLKIQSADDPRLWHAL
ncbi:transglutaminase-like cysteine peptidase [Ensifer soli]|uniref:transglutaminase-like cysteine peptidase n=1 Tax=Ciceribacter sp. sgz301302 TaxID=3342379 RepID=UPI0035B8C358